MILLKAMYMMLRYWRYIPNITSLATNSTLNPNIKKKKKEIPSITNLAKKTFLNAKINEVKHSYSGNGIGFYSRWLFSISNFDWGKNVIIFGVDMSSSAYTDNKKKDRYQNTW